MTSDYNKTGIKNYTPPTQSPESNPGIVYQPANKPTNPGSLKVAQQYFQNIVVFSKDGGKIDIGSQFPGDVAGIIIYGPNGQIVLSILNGDYSGGTVLASSTTATAALRAINDANGYAAFFSDGGTGTGNIVDIEMQNSSNTNSPLRIANAKIYNSYFRKIGNFQAGSGGVTLWTGDGTNTPNGVLSGSLGDFLIGGPGGHPFYCTGTTNWTQI
jgi:hypothetical protein